MKEIREKIVVVKREGIVYRYITKALVDREDRYIGCFKTKEEAVDAYKKFKERLENDCTDAR